MPWIPLHQTWQIYWEIYPPSIKHRCLEYCYSKLCISTGRSTPYQLSIDALNTITPNLADLPPSIEHRCLKYHYTKLGRTIPHQSNHRCLEYHYTKLGRSIPCPLSIDALNTVTPNLADILADLPPINWASMPWILLHKTWHIYPLSIEHRCIEYHYTKLGRSTPHQSSIDALNTYTPNLADLPPSIEHRCLEYCYTKLGRSTPQSSIDHWKTSIVHHFDI